MQREQSKENFSLETLQTQREQSECKEYLEHSKCRVKWINEEKTKKKKKIKQKTQSIILKRH